MTRLLLTAMALTLIPLSASAGQTVVHFIIRPMPAAKPALKYQLLPEVRELNPGNAAFFYLRCFAEQRNFFFSKEANAERARYLAMPLAELPVEKLRDYGGFALHQADWAARLDTLDWELQQHVQTEGMDLLMPELGRLEILAAALKVRLRAQVAGRHFDDAVRTAKTMFAFARHLGEYPRMPANLLGISIAGLAAGGLEDMVQQPGCPNLYWALTDLPCPLVDLRKGVQGDSTQVAAGLRLLRDDAPMTEEQLQNFVSHLSGVIGLARVQEGQTPRNLRAALVEEVKDTDRVRAARARLIQTGSMEDMVQRFLLVWRFPPLQVILLDDKREYELRRDERVKLLGLAPWQIDALADNEGVGCCDDGLFANFLPAIMEARRAQAQLEQRVAMLRHVEALRLYAAENGGKLPDKLADLPVPVPADPFTGKPFLYRLDGMTGHLKGSPPRGELQNSCFNVRYEMTIHNESVP